MAVVKPFMCIRPAADKAARVAALPYDVYNRKEACEAVKGNPLSFLNIDRAETQFGMTWIPMTAVSMTRPGSCLIVRLRKGSM